MQGENDISPLEPEEDITLRSERKISSLKERPSYIVLAGSSAAIGFALFSSMQSGSLSPSAETMTTLLPQRFELSASTPNIDVFKLVKYIKSPIIRLIMAIPYILLGKK